MKKWIILFTIPLLLFACSNKKKSGLLLFPFLGGTGDAASSAPAATNTGTTSTPDDTFTVVGLGATDPSQVAANTSSTGTETSTTTPTTTTDQANNSGSTNSGSGSTNTGSESTTGSGTGSETNTGSTTTPTTTTPTPEVAVVVTTPVADTTVTTNTTTTVVNQTNGNGGFNFETNVTVPVTVHLENEKGPIVNAPVTVSETQSNGETNILGQGTTNSQGTAVIPVSVPPTVTTVQISVIGVNPTTGEVQEVTGSVPVQIPAPAVNGTVTGTVVVAPTANLNANNFQPTNGCVKSIDADCDGVADQYDEFPNDPKLAFVARSGRYTIAFEDLFPDAGDADLNDHTTVFSTEMDKTPDNKVKVIRGIFTHVGKGAGYNHELRLSLDVPVGAKFQVSYVDGSNKAWTGCAAATKYVAGATGDCTGGTLTTAALKKGLLILPSSDKTLFGKQNSPAPGASFTIKDFVRGVTSNVVITFDEPVDLSTAKNSVGGHLNWFLAFNQKTNNVYRQIYRPGYFFGSNGKDTYIDSKGFPWAIIVPGVFNHPTAGSDIRKASSTGYAYFSTWAESNGTSHKDWYTQITNPTYVVKVKDFYTENGFSAYLLKAVRKNIFEVSASLIVIGAALGFFMKKRGPKNNLAV
ncbi:LruC domain-containing protein [Leptospira sp. 'Mane']|uniref:LruC domain-containing protein n=1 Tax=Leptospira sp. 'Mane' TaxID=3387407 RepID=UPI00398B00B3